MTTFAYIRLDAFDANTQRKTQHSMVGDYAKMKGLGELHPANIRVEACSPLTPLSERLEADNLTNLLRAGDALLIPYFSTLFSAPTSAAQFLRTMAQRGVRIFVVEIDLEITSAVPLMTTIFASYGRWESEVIQAERRLASAEDLHEEQLGECMTMALAKIGERMAKVDLGPAVKEAIRDSYRVARERVDGGIEKRKQTMALLSEEGKASLKRNRPDIFARLTKGMGGE